ncbi:MAG TPA: FliA/WhiG family RNA polymerase sigma factor [Solirubrobacteraceae bacterium]|nr:FliA/WhiG family RNA polymerase sigma factor [Solirubrobacteraceae bacterium]
MKTMEQHVGRASAPEVTAVWREYRRTGDLRLRDRLIFTFAPMVRHIVYRKVREIPPHCEVDDFLSCGMEALIRSIERYDPDKGATLEQFAWTRIHGAVLDELRRQDWAPRSLRRAERTIGSARQRLVAEQEREPTHHELAAAAGMTDEELSARMRDLAAVDIGSLNKTIQADDSTTIERIDTLESEDEDCDPTLSAERAVAKARFRKAFAQLPERERLVAVLLYVEGHTLNEIGARLGVSESRVSQIHTELRRRLRGLLKNDETLFTAAGWRP